MAYTIISQNNTTTTLSDENGNVITVPARVTLATSTDYTIIKVNNNSVDLEDGNGKIIRGVPACVVLAGEGGGDQHNLGYYATQAALEEAYPTAEAGDWAIVGATDTVWIWDEDTSAWVDSDQKGQVVSVNSKTGTVVLDAFDVDAVAQFETMPTASQANAGKVVQYIGATSASYTNGYFYKNIATTTASSATASQTAGSSLTDVAVVVATFETQITTSGSYVFTSDGADWSYDGNVVDLTDYGITYTGTPVADDAITVVYTAESTSYAWGQVDVQPSASGYLPLTGGTLTGDLTMQNSKVQLYNSSILGSFWLESADSGYLRIGKSATASNDDLFVNTGTVNQRSIAFGDSNGGRIGSANAKLEYVYTQKLSNGSDIAVPNVAGTMVVADYTGASQGDVLQINSQGNAVWGAPAAGITTLSITLPAADWSGSTQTVTATGVTASNTVIIGAAPSSQAEYTTCGVVCTAQGTDSLTFTCTSTPTNDLTVTVLILA